MVSLRWIFGVRSLDYAQDDGRSTVRIAPSLFVLCMYIPRHAPKRWGFLRRLQLFSERHLIAGDLGIPCHAGVPLPVRISQIVNRVPQCICQGVVGGLELLLEL